MELSTRTLLWVFLTCLQFLIIIRGEAMGIPGWLDLPVFAVVAYLGWRIDRWLLSGEDFALIPPTWKKK